MGDDQMLTIAQAALKAECSEVNIRKAINRKVLKATKFGSNWAITSSDLDVWINNPDNHRRGPKKRKS